MANFRPQSISMKNDKSFHRSFAQSSIATNKMYVEHLVIELSNSDHRENALIELTKMAYIFKDVAPILWNSFGTMAIFLQEIMSVYPALSPPSLTLAQSIRLCNVLALLQCVAFHPDTKKSFIKANLPIYLYPFLRTTSKLAPFEDLRIACLGVIGALVKVKTEEAIYFLMSSEIMPLCLQNMEIGNEMSKYVAIFIVEKVLSDKDGLAYVCATPERYCAINRALDIMVENLENQSPKSLKDLMISCYAHLSRKSSTG